MICLEKRWGKNNLPNFRNTETESSKKLELCILASLFHHLKFIL